MELAMFKILTIDDHEVVRGGIKGLFAPDNAQFGEARNGSEALKNVQDQEWDIAVLDISLGGRSGLDVLEELKRMRPQLPVLILSMNA